MPFVCYSRTPPIAATTSSNVATAVGAVVGIACASIGIYDVSSSCVDGCDGIHDVETGGDEERSDEATWRSAETAEHKLKRRREARRRRGSDITSGGHVCRCRNMYMCHGHMSSYTCTWTYSCTSTTCIYINIYVHVRVVAFSMN